MAHELQYMIERKGGAVESHDGRDSGGDDDALLVDVNTSVVSEMESGPTPTATEDAGGEAFSDEAEGEDEEDLDEISQYA